MSGPRRGLQSELDALQDQLGFTDQSVTKSAFCQARMALNPVALSDVLRRTAGQLAEQFEAPRWQGLRVLALDTTIIRVPNNTECALHFGYMNTSCGKWRALARASILWDVARQCFVDATLGHYTQTDRDLARQHLPHLGPTDLVVMDRGYPSRDWLAVLQEHRIPFCARITTRNWRAVSRFISEGQTDQIVNLGDRRQPLSLRLLQYLLPNGTRLVLVTNLLSANVAPADFAELYRQRWRIEEAFKHLKARLHVENWTGIMPVTVVQDFYATLIRANCAACLRLSTLPDTLEEVNDPPPTGWRRRLNLAYSVSCLMGNLVKMLLFPASEVLLERLVSRLRSSGGQVITRPGRVAKRVIGVRIQGFHTAYKAA